MRKFPGGFVPLRRQGAVLPGVMEKSLMCLFFQSGGSADSVLPLLFVKSLGISFVDVLE